MRSFAASGPCLVRLNRFAKLRQNRWVSTASGSVGKVRRSVSIQLAQPILKLTFSGLQSRRENGEHAPMQRPQFIERHFSQRVVVHFVGHRFFKQPRASWIGITSKGRSFWLS